MDKKSEKNYALVTGVSYRQTIQGYIYPVVRAYNPALKYFDVQSTDLDDVKQIQEIESCIPGDRIQYKTIVSYPHGQKVETYQIVKNFSAQDRLAQYLNESVIEKQK